MILYKKAPTQKTIDAVNEFMSEIKKPFSEDFTVKDDLNTYSYGGEKYFVMLGVSKHGLINISVWEYVGGESIFQGSYIFSPFYQKKEIKKCLKFYQVPI